jgi:hypothetical protein
VDTAAGLAFTKVPRKGQAGALMADRLQRLRAQIVAHRLCIWAQTPISRAVAPLGRGLICRPARFAGERVFSDGARQPPAERSGVKTRPSSSRARLEIRPLLSSRLAKSIGHVGPALPHRRRRPLRGIHGRLVLHLCVDFCAEHYGKPHQIEPHQQHDHAT